MWEADPDVLVTDLGDELILMHAARSEMFSLGASGRVAWGALPGRVEDVTAALTRVFEVGPERAAADAAAFLASLEARGVVRRA